MHCPVVAIALGLWIPVTLLGFPLCWDPLLVNLPNLVRTIATASSPVASDI